MIGIGTAKVKCPKCGAALDVQFCQEMSTADSQYRFDACD